MKKYSKYKNSICNFDDFIILCDARFGIEITCTGDAEEILNEKILNLIKCNSEINGASCIIKNVDVEN